MKKRALDQMRNHDFLHVSALSFHHRGNSRTSVRIFARSLVTDAKLTLNDAFSRPSHFQKLFTVHLFNYMDYAQFQFFFSAYLRPCVNNLPQETKKKKRKNAFFNYLHKDFLRNNSQRHSNFRLTCKGKEIHWVELCLRSAKLFSPKGQILIIPNEVTNEE